MLIQMAAPGEGGMVVVFDVPTLAVMFLLQSGLGWPDGVTDAFDLTFHAIGLMSWFVLGLGIGFIAQRYVRRTPLTRSQP